MPASAGVHFTPPRRPAGSSLALGATGPHEWRVSSLVVESVDLADLTERLRHRFEAAPPIGYLNGRTVIRDAVASELDCSELEAENIVDTLIAQGFVRYGGDPTFEIDDGRRWSLVT